MEELFTEDGALWAVDSVSETRRVYAHRQPLTDSVRLLMSNVNGSASDYLVPEERAGLAKLLLTGLTPEQILAAIPGEWIADHDDAVKLSALADLTPKYGIRYVEADGTVKADTAVLALSDRQEAEATTTTFANGVRAVVVEQLVSEWIEVN